MSAHEEWCNSLRYGGGPCNCNGQPPLRAARGSVTPDALIVAFVQGAQWWEYHKTGATMWGSDRDQAECEAETRVANGTLGKSPNVAAERSGGDKPKTL